MMDIEVETGKDRAGDINPGCSSYSGMVHSKKVIKHALRQQAKRRRKNTTIASGNSRALPQIVVKPLAPPPAPPPVITPPVPVDDPPASIQHNNTVEEPAATMREVLASLPGFSLKSSRRRSTKKLSAAAQLEAGLVDLESPASILASTSLRALLNRHTFQGLPPLYQRKLAQLLPSVDRQDAATSGLNNEFFARACLEWRKRLAEGEFTPENQQRLKMEAERDKNKLDPWKLKHFEPIWGDKREPKVRLGIHCINETRAAPHGGAVTRSSLRLRLESTHEPITTPITPPPKLIYTRQSNPDKTETERENETEVDVEVDADIAPTIEDAKEPEAVPIVFEGASPEPEAPPVIPESLTPPTIEEQEPEVEAEPEPQPEPEPEPPQEIDLEQEQSYPEAGEGSPAMQEPMEIELQEELHEEMSEEVQLELNLPKVLEGEAPQEVPEAIPSAVPEPSRVEFPPEEPEIFVSTIIPSPTVAKPDIPEESVIEIPADCDPPILNDCHTLAMNLDVTEIALDPQEPFEEFSSPKQDKMFEIPECESAAAVESICEPVKTPEGLIIEEHVINVQIEDNGMPQVLPQSVPDTEPIPEGMEIDSETLQRIHELEVRGEMREAYEEISGCTEEIIYPILEGMDMGSSGSDEAEGQNGVVEGEEIREAEMTESNEDEELRDANNYVCSEMLDCSWSVDPPVGNNSGIEPSAQDIQVPWPLVAAALDGSVAANITVTTQEDCSDTSTTTDSTTSVNPPQVVQQVQQVQQFSNESLSSSSSNEGVNCVALSVAQATPFTETMTLNAPVTSCLLKNVQQSSPIIAFPPLQSIRFVPRFQQSVNSRIQGAQNSIGRIGTGIRPGGPQVPVVQGHPQSAIVVQQHQTAISVPAVTQGRQIVANMQPQYTSPSVNPRSRSGGQVGYRGSRNGGKEQGSRSRSSTKEPPGAVNLERSYQICQAVIQSSPNRDQLKAHLKPPPSLLARGDGAFTTNKSGGRTITTVKAQKQPISHSKNPNKTQTVMLRQVFTTTRQQPVEMTEGTPTTTVAQLGAVAGNGSTNFGQYILVQRTGVSDGAPRASSAPPLPPQIAGLGVGVHLVRGRPASAGEGSHQAVTLKARGGADGRGGGGAEPAAPGVIMGGDPPPPCECHMRGAMVICRQCGAFCHDDCMGPQRICATCLIR
ncbi:polycomb protein Asx [Diachasma alloeum]|uniref:polycomb protein Asx n=1 Tax=Diachasma alloeum TaxID=454923 RepID=UPI0007382C18|nr:polycomb protein Asx [Diachasma alloeum]